MPRITLTVDGKAYDIPDAAVPAIQVHVDRTNAAANTALSLGRWLGLHPSEPGLAHDPAPPRAPAPPPRPHPPPPPPPRPPPPPPETAPPHPHAPASPPPACAGATMA